MQAFAALQHAGLAHRLGIGAIGGEHRADVLFARFLHPGFVDMDQQQILHGQSPCGRRSRSTVPMQRRAATRHFDTRDQNNQTIRQSPIRPAVNSTSSAIATIADAARPAGVTCTPASVMCGFEAVSAQLTALEPMLDKINDYYFEKNHDEAFFFHTNTLYLVLAVDKKIESQLQVADTERAAQNAQEYGYYTNQMATLFAIQDALAGQEGRITDKVNAETKQASAAATDALLNQIKLLVPDADEIARRKALAADMAEIKRELGQIRAQLNPTNK